MKKADTWMPFYVTDYLGDTMHLTTVQHGAYLLLLLACWKSGGELADDDATLAAITRLSAADWRKNSATLRAFFKSDGELLLHTRVLAELDKAQKLSDARSQSGKKGGRPPKAKQEETYSFADAEANTKLTETPSPSPSSLRSETKSGKDGSEPLQPPLALSAEPDLTGFKPTQAGLACRAIKAAGVIDANPGHAGLLRLLDGGVTVAELASTAEELVGKGKGKFALLLATVEGRRVDAAAAGDVAKAPEVVDPGADAAEKTKREQAEFMARPVSKPPEALKALVQKLKVTA